MIQCLYRMILARRMNLALARRAYGTKVTLTTSYPANVHTVNEDQVTVDAMELNPDRNIEYVNSLHDPLCTRPYMLGMPGTETAALREREAGAWGDISADDQVCSSPNVNVWVKQVCLFS